jgi:hypothetical protein
LRRARGVAAGDQHLAGSGRVRHARTMEPEAPSIGAGGSGPVPTVMRKSAHVVLRRLRRKLRPADGRDAGESSTLHNAHESDVTLLLPSPKHKRRCSEELVDALSQRVMRLSLDELGGYFGDGWCREIQPWLVLEGPSLGFKLLIVKVNGWELGEMGIRINEVFNKHWKREMDALPPR